MAEPPKVGEMSSFTSNLTRTAVFLLLSFFLLQKNLSGEEIKKASAVTWPKAETLSNGGDEKRLAEDVTTSTTHIRWCGHAFVYLTTSSGVRIAIDPFGPESVKYSFPDHLPADVVLISDEDNAYSSAERLFGSPQVFRSVTAIGLNKANGLLFKGVEVNEESSRSLEGGKRSTAFAFNLDGINFAHLGAIGDSLSSKQRDQIGPVDVLFLPVGNPNISPADLVKIATDLQAKIIIPITFKTWATEGLNLRSRDEFLAHQPFPMKKVDAIELPINKSLLPEQPTVYVLNVP